MAIPSVLKGYTCEIDGRGYAGKADIELPELSLVTEEYAAGGMAGKVKVDMGLVEAMEAKVTLYEYAADVLRQWGLANGNAVGMTFRGASADDAGTVRAIKIRVRGQVQTLTMGSWEAGAKTSMELTLSCRSYEYSQDGQTIIHVDPELMIRTVGGVDQMAAIRGAIGL